MHSIWNYLSLALCSLLSTFILLLQLRIQILCEMLMSWCFLPSWYPNSNTHLWFLVLCPQQILLAAVHQNLELTELLPLYGSFIATYPPHSRFMMHPYSAVVFYEYTILVCWEHIPSFIWYSLVLRLLSCRKMGESLQDLIMCPCVIMCSCWNCGE